MGAIAVLAQNIMDQYYQQYRSDTDFFRLYHFKYMAAIGYAKLVQDEYKEQYEKNKAEEGYGYLSAPSDWLVSEKKKVDRDDEDQYFVELDNFPMTFLFDNQNTAIQDVEPVGNNNCREFQRIQKDLLWQYKLLSDFTDVTYWFVDGKKIIFKNLLCKPKEVKITYIPGLSINIDDNFNIPVTKEADVFDWVLNRLIIARQGTVIDWSQDGNPNKTVQHEISNIFGRLTTNAR